MLGLIYALQDRKNILWWYEKLNLLVWITPSPCLLYQNRYKFWIYLGVSQLIMGTILLFFFCLWAIQMVFLINNMSFMIMRLHGVSQVKCLLGNSAEIFCFEMGISDSWEMLGAVLLLSPLEEGFLWCLEFVVFHHQNTKYRMHEAKKISLLRPYIFDWCYSDSAFYFLIPTQTENPRNAYLYTLRAFFLKYFFFFSLSDLGLDQFIVKRYDGKVSTLDH